MATFRNSGIFDYDFPGDGTRPAETIAPGDTVDTDFNPNQLYFDWVDGEPPEGAGDFNPPQPAEPDVQLELESSPEPEPEPDEPDVPAAVTEQE